MNQRGHAEDWLVEIEALRSESPASALSRLNDAPSDLRSRPEARLAQAELVHELRGPAAARSLLEALVGDFPSYASAFYRLSRVHDELGDRAAARECRLTVHRLDAILDDALEPLDETEVERAMTPVALEALGSAPSWLRGRLSSTPLSWRRRPSRDRVAEGFDPRGLAEFREAREERSPGAAFPAQRLTLVIYRTNLLASADGERELRGNLTIAVRELLERMA